MWWLVRPWRSRLAGRGIHYPGSPWANVAVIVVAVVVPHVVRERVGVVLTEPRLLAHHSSLY